MIETTRAEEWIVTQYNAFFKDAESERRRIARFRGLPDADVKSVAALVRRGRRDTHFTIEQLIDARASTEVIDLYRALIGEATQSAGAITRKENKGKIANAAQIETAGTGFASWIDPDDLSFAQGSQACARASALPA